MRNPFLNAIRVLVCPLAFAALLTAQAPVAARGQADTSLQLLARILAQKGVISATELAGIENAGPEQGTRLLAGLLYRKGMLTDAEAAALGIGVAPGIAPGMPGQPAAPQNQQPLKESAKPERPAAPVTAQSKFPLTVYGTILLNSFFNTGATNNTDVPLLAAKKGDPTNTQNFGMTARSSRFGVRFQGPEIGGARVSGQVELDLFGGKPSGSNSINMDLMRVRLAYGRLDWHNSALEIGQDWSIFAPLTPTTLAGFGIPNFSSAGNPWIRTPQVRWEMRREVDDQTRVQWQVAAVDPNTGDNPPEYRLLRTPLVGERGRMPALESRLGMTRRVGSQELALGLSSHYGRGKNVGLLGTQTVSRPVDSWGVALDYTLPLHRRVVLTGEAFEGRALGIFSVTNGLSVLPAGTGGEHGVQAAGGWMQSQFNLPWKTQINLAYGIEKPDGSELRPGDRSRNQGYMANIMYKYSPHVTFAWEWRHFLTGYLNQQRANNRVDHLNFSAAYTF